MRTAAKNALLQSQGNLVQIVELSKQYAAQFCDFDIEMGPDCHEGLRTQERSLEVEFGHFCSRSPYSPRCAPTLDSMIATKNLPYGRILGHKTFALQSHANDWRHHVSFGPDGVDVGIDLDLCQHLSVRRTQPDDNILADAISCGFAVESHRHHGDGSCTNATYHGSYKPPQGHERCERNVHRGTCHSCPTEYMVEVNTH